VKVGDWVVIRGLTHKTKNRIRNHGEEWVLIRKGEFEQHLFMETDPKKPDQPYCFWGQVNIDFEVKK
jgi:hypothetical protein